jgi:hypothetical protein
MAHSSLDLEVLAMVSTMPNNLKQLIVSNWLAKLIGLGGGI